MKNVNQIILIIMLLFINHSILCLKEITEKEFSSIRDQLELLSSDYRLIHIEALIKDNFEVYLSIGHTDEDNKYYVDHYIIEKNDLETIRLSYMNIGTISFREKPSCCIIL